MPIIENKSPGSTVSESYSDLKAVEAPAAPPAGYARRYVDIADGKLKVKKPNGAVIDLEAEGGQAAQGETFALSTYEANLGLTLRHSGTFDITGLTGLTPGRPVLVQQAAGPYTGKGEQVDEPEMGMVHATGYVLNSTTIRVLWSACSGAGPVSGNVKFNYIVG